MEINHPIRHYSNKPVPALKSVKQLPDPDMKPQGFWVSVEDGDGWETWCRGEDFGLDRLSHVHEIEFADDANILVIPTVWELDQFHDEYRDLLHTKASDFRAIKWAQVADEYHGIIIAPYQWARRLDGPARWYYGWDCSSGCIWNADAIADIKLLETVS